MGKGVICANMCPFLQVMCASHRLLQIFRMLLMVEFEAVWLATRTVS